MLLLLRLLLTLLLLLELWVCLMLLWGGLRALLTQHCSAVESFLS